VENGRAEEFNANWRDVLGRGKRWKQRANEGRAALLRLAPELDVSKLWSTT
jgi:hypothetical protein